MSSQLGLSRVAEGGGRRQCRGTCCSGKNCSAEFLCIAVLPGYPEAACPAGQLQRPVPIKSTLPAICSLTAGHQAGAPVLAAVCLAPDSLHRASGCAGDALLHDAAQPGAPTGPGPVSCGPGAVAGASRCQVCLWQAVLQLPALIVYSGLRHSGFTCCCTCAIALQPAAAAFFTWLPCVTASAGVRWCIKNRSITPCTETCSLGTAIKVCCAEV